MTGKGQNAASANCYFKGKGNRPPLAPTMLHIFSQWGSLMCEQGSGRAVNRAFYEAARGELGCQWKGLSRVCHVPTLGPGLFVLMAARDWLDCGPCLHWMCVKQESPLSTTNWPLGLHQNPRFGPSGIAGLYWLKQGSVDGAAGYSTQPDSCVYGGWHKVYYMWDKERQGIKSLRGGKQNPQRSLSQI